jgi:hypothetical protein
MKKYLIIFIFSLMTASGCKNQPTMLLQGALINAVSPRTYTGHGSDIKYAGLVNQTYEKRQELQERMTVAALRVDEGLECKENTDVSLEDISRLSNKVRDLACSCSSWGTCSQDVCSCDILCPSGMDIFDRRVVRQDNISENSLAFTNNGAGVGTYGHEPYTPMAPAPILIKTKEEEERLKKRIEESNNKPKEIMKKEKVKISLKPKDLFGYQGFCWGHANLTQKFNRLAFFQKSSPKKFQDDPAQRSKHYREVINKIANNEPVEIEGYAGLNEFSADPEIQEYMVKKVGDLWKKNAASFQALKSVFSSKTPMSPQETIKDLETRIQNHQQPQLLFNIEGMGAHVVLVNNISTNEAGSKIICVRDNNYLPAEGSCSSGIVLTQQGAYYNTPNGQMRVKTFQVAHNENSEVVEQQKNLTEKCSKEKNCTTSK